MSTPKTYRTPAGRDLTDADLDAIAEEVEHKDYDVSQLKARRRGRPTIGTGPADVFTQGHRYKATWDLTNPELPLRIVGADGKVMHLPAGLTWIHLVDPGTPITVS